MIYAYVKNHIVYGKLNVGYATTDKNKIVSL